ncbi:MAG: DnaJ family domain-containing protein [Halofilum sp. (in: g-proteobacteria)]
MALTLLDQLAEQRIAEARDRGDLDGLPNAGQRLELDDDSMVPPTLRAAYRVLRNAGYLPEEMATRREIHDAEALLRMARTEEERATAGARLRLLLNRLGDTRSGSLVTQEAYLQRVRARVQRELE